MRINPLEGAGKERSSRKSGNAAGSKKGTVSESSTEKGDSGPESVDSKVTEKKAKVEMKGKGTEETASITNSIADVTTSADQGASDDVAFIKASGLKDGADVAGSKYGAKAGEPKGDADSQDAAGSKGNAGGANDAQTSDPKVAKAPVVAASEEIIRFSWLPEDIIPRLRILAAWQRPTYGVYTISSVPPSGTSFANTKDALLCYKGKPLTMAFVARIMNTFFRVGEGGQPARCASVMFKFMREVDDLACRALLYEKAKPAPTGRTRKIFWAGSRRSIFSKELQSSTLRDFDEVYDGSEKMKSYKKMDKLDNSQINPNDIVLLECQIHRFTPNSKYIGTEWETRLRLVRIVRLFAAPLQSAKDPLSENEGDEKKGSKGSESSDDDFEF